jgi:hypothetical protein
LYPDGHQKRTCFWADTVTAWRDAGKVVLFGAITPTDTPGSAKDFAASVAALHRSPRIGHGFGRRKRYEAPLAYANRDIIRGPTSSEFAQRVPVPLGMWRPFTNTGTPLRLSSPAVIRIAAQAAALLICYEQLIPWPMLTAFLDGPTIVVAIANQFWIAGTAISKVQRNTSRAWARLFHVPWSSHLILLCHKRTI